MSLSYVCLQSEARDDYFILNSPELTKDEVLKRLEGKEAKNTVYLVSDLYSSMNEPLISQAFIDLLQRYNIIENYKLTYCPFLNLLWLSVRGDSSVFVSCVPRDFDKPEIIALTVLHELSEREGKSEQAESLYKDLIQCVKSNSTSGLKFNPSQWLHN